MISVSTVYAASTGVYVAALAVLLGWLLRIPESRRRYCYPVVTVVGVAALTTALSTVGVGVLAVSASEIDVPSVFDDLVAYPVLWAVAGLLAGESRRMVGVLALVPAIQVLSFHVAAAVGGVVGLVGLFVVVGGHGLIASLLLGPIWDRTDRLPQRRRLLHWKARNLLLFLIGMLIAFALLSVAGVFDSFVTAVLAEYVGLLIRVGFAGFLFANVDAVTRASGDRDRRADANATGERDQSGAPGAD